MKKNKKIVILLNLIGLLFVLSLSVFFKENTLKKGTLVLLELAPVDPRSLMQGDYMQLNYAIASDNTFSQPVISEIVVEDGETESLFEETKTEKRSKRGFVVITLDSLGIGQKVRFQEKKEPKNPNELVIKYYYSDWNFSIGAESYFFQEGRAEEFENAKYGGLVVDEKGNSILVGLYDANRNLIH